MTKHILLLALLAIACFGTVSCELERETPEGTLQFELYDGAFLLEGPQRFTFGQIREFTIHSWFVTTMKIIEVDGWSAEFYNEGNNGRAIIVAPASAALGEARGDIEVVMTGPGGQKLTYFLSVETY